MKNAVKIVGRIIRPPKAVMIFVPPIVFAALILVFVRGKNDSAAAYPIYLMSAYCLIIWVVPVPRLIKRIKSAVIKRLSQISVGEKYISDSAFRGYVSICRGMTVNFLYVLFRTFLGIRYSSVWSFSVAAYYSVLGALRLYLIIGHRRAAPEAELRCCRRTALMLFILNIPMGGMILLMICTDSGYSYPGYVIYLSAAYTFYTVISSIIGLTACRKLGSPILSAATVLNFVAALMSLLGLQTAMMAQFSEGQETFRRTMNTVLGTAVWCAVVAIALLMLHSTKTRNEVDSLEQIRK